MCMGRRCNKTARRCSYHFGKWNYEPRTMRVLLCLYLFHWHRMFHLAAKVSRLLPMLMVNVVQVDGARFIAAPGNSDSKMC
jgi:hypothetical protein